MIQVQTLMTMCYFCIHLNLFGQGKESKDGRIFLKRKKEKGRKRREQPLGEQRPLVAGAGSWAHHVYHLKESFHSSEPALRFLRNQEHVIYFPENFCAKLHVTRCEVISGWQVGWD